MILSLEHVALPLERFDYSNHRLTAELSDFGPFAEQIGGRCGLKFIHQLYDDACDAGIAIRSHHTQRVVRFFWREDLGRNPDYSLGYSSWEFEVCPEDRRLTHVRTVTIFND